MEKDTPAPALNKPVEFADWVRAQALALDHSVTELLKAAGVGWPTMSRYQAGEVDQVTPQVARRLKKAIRKLREQA